MILKCAKSLVTRNGKRVSVWFGAASATKYYMTQSNAKKAEKALQASCAAKKRFFSAAWKR